MFKVNWWKILTIAIISLGLMAIGFFIGRKTTKVNNSSTEVVYVKGDTINDTVYIPEPFEQYVDTANIIKNCIKDGKFYDLFPEKIQDSIIVITKHDTIKIMGDWATKRYYTETLFDIDTVGKCDYRASVQYNELKMLGYEFTPITKQTSTTDMQVNHFSPYIGIGISVLPSVQAEAGVFIDESWGFSVNGQYNLKYKEIDGLPMLDVGLKVVKKF